MSSSRDDQRPPRPGRGWLLLVAIVAAAIAGAAGALALTRGSGGRATRQLSAAAPAAPAVTTTPDLNAAATGAAASPIAAVYRAEAAGVVDITASGIQSPDQGTDPF